MHHKQPQTARALTAARGRDRREAHSDLRPHAAAQRCDAALRQHDRPEQQDLHVVVVQVEAVDVDELHEQVVQREAGGDQVQPELLRPAVIAGTLSEEKTIRRHGGLVAAALRHEREHSADDAAAERMLEAPAQRLAADEDRVRRHGGFAARGYG